MAKIVLGIGSSHGPTMRTRPNEIETLGKKDIDDPRLDYQALLKWAKPDVAKELVPEVWEEKYGRCQDGIAKIGKLLAEAAPDTLVVLSNLHGQT
ncbi:MAG TPA: hypothetical protein VGK54_11350, partial [Chloroflexota bacterium]